MRFRKNVKGYNTIYNANLGDNVNVESDLKPYRDSEVDLGASDFKYDYVYANNIVSTNIYGVLYDEFNNEAVHTVSTPLNKVNSNVSLSFGNTLQSSNDRLIVNPNLSIDNLTTGSILSTNVSSNNVITTNVSSSNIITTNMFSDYMNTLDIVSSNISTSNLNTSNIKSTNLTSSNILTTNISSTNIYQNGSKVVSTVSAPLNKINENISVSVGNNIVIDNNRIELDDNILLNSITTNDGDITNLESVDIRSTNISTGILNTTDIFNDNSIITYSLQNTLQTTQNLRMNNIGSTLIFNSSGNLVVNYDSETLTLTTSGQLTTSLNIFGDDPMTVQSLLDYANFTGIDLSVLASLFGIDVSEAENTYIVSLSYDTNHFTESADITGTKLRIKNAGDKRLLFHQNGVLTGISQVTADFASGTSTMANLRVDQGNFFNTDIQNASIQSLRMTSGTFGNLLTTNLSTSNLQALDVEGNDIYYTNSTFTNLISTNLSTSNLQALDVEGNDIYYTNSTFTNILATNGTFDNIKINDLFTTNLTVSNIKHTGNGTLGNLNIFQIDEVSLLNLQGNGTASNLFINNSTINNLKVQDITFTNMTGGKMEITGLSIGSPYLFNCGSDFTFDTNDSIGLRISRIRINNTTPNVQNNVITKGYYENYITAGKGLKKTITGSEVKLDTDFIGSDDITITGTEQLTFDLSTPTKNTISGLGTRLTAVETYQNLRATVPIPNALGVGLNQFDLYLYTGVSVSLAAAVASISVISANLDAVRGIIDNVSDGEVYATSGKLIVSPSKTISPNSISTNSITASNLIGLSNLSVGNIISTNISTSNLSGLNNLSLTNLTTNSLSGLTSLSVGNIITTSITSANNINGEHSIRIINNNTGSSAYSIFRLSTGTNSSFNIFQNSETRTADGGIKTTTLRNDAGNLRLQAFSGNGILLESTGNIFIQRSTTYTGEIGSLTLSGSANTSKRLAMGFDEGNNYAWIQSVWNTVDTTPLYLNPLSGSGNVGIRTTTASHALTVSGGVFSTSMTTGSMIMTNLTTSSLSGLTTLSVGNVISSVISTSSLTGLSNLSLTNLTTASITGLTSLSVGNVVSSVISTSSLVLPQGLSSTFSSIIINSLGNVGIGINNSPTLLGVAGSFSALSGSINNQTTTNMVLTSLSTASITGLSNLSLTNISTTSLSGITNLSLTNISTTSLSGISNLSLTNISTTSLSGITNLSLTNISTTSLSGISNLSLTNLTSSTVRVFGSSAFTSELGTLNITGTTGAKRLAMGFDEASNYAWIQSVWNTQYTTPLLINPIGGIGNVGIGGTLANHRLTVNGGISSTSITTGSITGLTTLSVGSVFSNSFKSSGVVIGGDYTRGCIYNDVNWGFLFKSNNTTRSTVSVFSVSDYDDTNVMRIDNNYILNAYYGFNSPSATISNLLSQGITSNTVSSQFVRIYKATNDFVFGECQNSTSYLQFGVNPSTNDSSSSYVWQFNNYDLKFGTNNTERLRIRSNGVITTNEIIEAGYFRVPSLSAVDRTLYLTNANGNLEIVAQSSGNSMLKASNAMTLATNYTDRVIIDRTSGNVNILNNLTINTGANMTVGVGASIKSIHCFKQTIGGGFGLGTTINDCSINFGKTFSDSTKLFLQFSFFDTGNLRYVGKIKSISATGANLTIAEATGAGSSSSLEILCTVFENA